MRFSIPRETLLKPLAQVCNVVERRQTLPILSSLLLTVSQNSISLLATDLEIEIAADVFIEDTGEEGKIALPARKLLDICRALPEQASIEFSLHKDRMTLRSGKSRFSLATAQASEFPNVEAMGAARTISLPQSDLRKALEATQFAMAHQDVRYYLNGLMLEQQDGNLTVVTTDGHRLALCRLATTTESTEARQVIIPRKGVQELLHILDGTEDLIELQIGSNHIHIKAANISLTSKLIDGRFPDYQRVIPQGGDKVVRANRQALRQALARVSVVSNEKHRSVRVSLQSDSIKLHTQNIEQEEAEEEISADYQGEPVEIGFNINYLQDAITAITEEEIKIILTDANSSCLVESAENNNPRYVIMPMRL